MVNTVRAVYKSINHLTTLAFFCPFFSTYTDEEGSKREEKEVILVTVFSSHVYVTSVVRRERKPSIFLYSSPFIFVVSVIRRSLSVKVYDMCWFSIFDRFRAVMRTRIMRFRSLFCVLSRKTAIVVVTAIFASHDLFQRFETIDFIMSYLKQMSKRYSFFPLASRKWSPLKVARF